MPRSLLLPFLAVLPWSFDRGAPSRLSISSKPPCLDSHPQPPCLACPIQATGLHLLSSILTVEAACTPDCISSSLSASGCTDIGCLCESKNNVEVSDDPCSYRSMCQTNSSARDFYTVYLSAAIPTTSSRPSNTLFLLAITPRSARPVRLRPCNHGVASVAQTVRILTLSYRCTQRAVQALELAPA